jgi:hypothetical protein
VQLKEQNGGTRSDDGGEVVYQLDGTDKTFEIFYHAKGGDTDATINVQMNFSTLGNDYGSKIPLTWEGDNGAPGGYATPFILASSDTDLSTATIISNSLPQSWMANTYDRISCLQLREFAMPGTHDSGMSEFHEGQGLAIAGNTKTQIQNIAGQLEYGARWFDIRPVSYSGNWETGHYGFTGGDWRGGNGQTFASVIEQVNAFTASNAELIILSLSHGVARDDFHDHESEDGTHLTQDDWNEIMTILLQINHRVTGEDPSTDLTQLPLSHFIENGPAVIIYIEDNVYGDDESPGPVVDVSAFVAEGIFSKEQFPVINNYANSDDIDSIMEDQLNKMVQDRTSPQSEMFLLSWTWTIQNIGDALNFEGIIGNAQILNAQLPQNLWNNTNSNRYPNMITVDAYPTNMDITALAVAINYHFAPKCPSPGSGSSSTSSSASTSSTMTSSTSSSTLSTSSSTTLSTSYSTTSPSPPPNKSPTQPPTTPPCGAGLLVCSVQDPTRLEAPWAGVSAPFPQCYDPTLYTCSDNFLCPINAPKISGEYACGTSQVLQPPCSTGLLICDVQDPTRLEVPWAGVSSPFPQCYDPALYICSDNFLCPVNAPKIAGEYACGPLRESQVMAQAIICGLGYCQ